MGGERTVAPLIVQGDGTLILATGAPGAGSVADGLRRFAELAKCPGDYHHYRLTRHSLWNAAAAGVGAERVLDFLRRASGAPLPPAVERGIVDIIGRWGRLRLERGSDGDELWLRADDPALLAKLAPKLDDLLDYPLPDCPLSAAEALARLPDFAARGVLKARLAALGWPVRDEAGYAGGAALGAGPRPDLRLRPYQREAIAAFARRGSGLVLLPCGAGKTLVGVGAMLALGCRTLVLCPSATAVRQWIDAYAAFTDLPAGAAGGYDGRRRAIRPVTVTTYHMLTARGGGGAAPHLERVMAEDWGLIVFDEVHLLPADVFRLAAGVQSRRRLGLTATPVREDGRESDLFALVGPVLYTAPWSRLEAEGWIAPVECVEVRVPPDWGATAAGATPLSHREAASSGAKWPAVRAILRRRRGEGALVIGQYLDQLRDLAARLEA
ncbi:MAG: helicase-associated domain-containing protein, partial [Chloroflexota bacterium]|nr:helicase-associated domain-containing protein [Chloroflexota bacterium]